MSTDRQWGGGVWAEGVAHPSSRWRFDEVVARMAASKMASSSIREGLYRLDSEIPGTPPSSRGSSRLLLFLLETTKGDDVSGSLVPHIHRRRYVLEICYMS